MTHSRLFPDEGPQRSTRRLIPLTDWPDYHPWPSVSALRHYRFQSRTDPAYAAWRRVFRSVGRRVLVDETAFFEIVDAEQC